MKYKQLINGQWIECEFNAQKKQIQLYNYLNGVMVPDAIGLY